MIPSAEYLRRESGKSGFRPEILEKVVRLLDLLEAIRRHPYLKSRVVLKGGTELTLDQCIRKKKPYRLIDAREVAVERAAELLAEFVARNDIAVLNVAGPRASKWPQAHEYASSVVRRLILDSHDGG